MDILKRLSGFTDGISNADVYKLAHDEIALLRAKLSQPTPSQSDDEKDAYMARLETLIYRIRNHDKRCVQHEWVENVLASKPAQLSKPQPTSQDAEYELIGEVKMCHEPEWMKPKESVQWLKTELPLGAKIYAVMPQ